jgi:hypothetical protein
MSRFDKEAAGAPENRGAEDQQQWGRTNFPFVIFHLSFFISEDWRLRTFATVTSKDQMNKWQMENSVDWLIAGYVGGITRLF